MDAKHHEAISTIEHFRQLLGMAERLASLGAVIYEHHWEYLVFGRWIAVTSSRHRRFEFSWDGRESSMSVSRSEFSDSRSRQEWSAPEVHRLPSADPSAPFEYIEQFFAEHRNA